MNGDGLEHRRRQCQVKQAVGARQVVEFRQLLVQQLEVASFRVAASDVAVDDPELLVPVAFIILHFHVLVAASAKLFDRQFCARVSDESRCGWQQTIAVKPPQRWINFLLRQVALKKIWEFKICVVKNSNQTYGSAHDHEQVRMLIVPESPLRIHHHTGRQVVANNFQRSLVVHQVGVVAVMHLIQQIDFMRNWKWENEKIFD